MQIGILREEKTPSDSRVTLTPKQASYVSELGIPVVVQSSKVRCFSDEEYRREGIDIVESLDDCDILLGVKEVPPPLFIPNKTYFIFSHTAKEQAYNQDLLKAAINKNITLIDYEYLKDNKDNRVIAFGKFAGIVGAHNALWTYAKRTNAFDLPRLKDLNDYSEAKTLYKTISLPNDLRVVLTGCGRVSRGAAMVLKDMGLHHISPNEYLTEDSTQPVYTQLSSFQYAKRSDGMVTDQIIDFYENPSEYESDFKPFTRNTDIMINGIYWDPDAPQFFTLDEMKNNDFSLKVIGDVTCDIAPESSIPSTLRASTIDDPIYGFNRLKGIETAPHQEDAIDIMAIDNLPNELPKDASKAFGDMFIKACLPELKRQQSDMLKNASILVNGKLGPSFGYLQEYAGLR